MEIWGLAAIFGITGKGCSPTQHQPVTSNWHGTSWLLAIKIRRPLDENNQHTSAPGAHPKQPGAVFEDGHDVIVTQTLGIRGVVLIRGEGLGGPVKAVEPSTPGAHPEHARAVFKDGCDIIVTQTLGIRGVVLIPGEHS